MTVPSDYRLARPVVVRMMGAALVLAGLVVVLAVAGTALWAWPVAVLSTVLSLAALAVAGLALVLSRRATVVRLDDTGYAVRWVRGAGVKAGRWKEVEDVVAATVEGSRCVVLRRRDGRTTTIPVSILDQPVDVFVQDLRRHLQTGHGYRPAR